MSLRKVLFRNKGLSKHPDAIPGFPRFSSLQRKYIQPPWGLTVLSKPPTAARCPGNPQTAFMGYMLIQYLESQEPEFQSFNPPFMTFFWQLMATAWLFGGISEDGVAVSYIYISVASFRLFFKIMIISIQQRNFVNWQVEIIKVL